MKAPPNIGSNLTLRERKKAETRAKVLKIAHLLFDANSFDGTTLDEICSQSMISKRTFFRYFRDKEALVFPHRETRIETFVTFLETHQDAENPFEVLRMATKVFGGQYNENKERIRNKQLLVRSSEALLAREREIDQAWEQQITLAFSRRSGGGPYNDLWAQVLAGAIMGVVRATMRYWFEGGCQDDLTQIGLDALDCLERGFPAPFGDAMPREN